MDQEDHSVPELADEAGTDPLLVVHQNVEGVEPDVIGSIIYLLRNRYEAARLAILYLESEAEEFAASGIANLRDALSHIASAVSENSTHEQRQKDVHSAAEHLRRAVVESYQQVVEAKLMNIADRYATYRAKSLKRERFYRMSHLTDHSQFQKDLEASKKLYAEARDYKDTNVWDEAWMEGVVTFTEAVELLVGLDHTLSAWEGEIAQRRFSFWTQAWFMIAGVVLGVIATIILTLLFRASTGA